MSNFKLIEKTMNGNTADMDESIKAIGKDKESLTTYCWEKYQKSIGEDRKSIWDPFYVIEPTDVVIVL